MKLTWLGSLMPIAAILGACSSTSKPEASPGTNTLLPAPLAGPCTEGQTRACHVEISQSRPGWVNCYSGTQACTSGMWAACSDGSTSTRAFRPDVVASGGVKTLAVGAPPSQTAPPCSDDPCNPECWGYNEIPAAPITNGTAMDPGPPPATVSVPTVYTAPINHATCAPGARPIWDLLMWRITAAPTGTWGVDFQIRTAPESGTGPGAWTAFKPIAAPPAAGEPAVRTGGNPLDLYAALGALPDARNPYLELRATVSSSDLVGPQLESWQLTFACRDEE